MEQVNLGYDTKNIHVPNKKTYLHMMINSIEKLVHNLRWRSHFFLKPQPNPNKKENFGFKSTAPAPKLQELKGFEEGLIDLVKSIKFQEKPNEFQKN